MVTKIKYKGKWWDRKEYFAEIGRISGLLNKGKSRPDMEKGGKNYDKLVEASRKRRQYKTLQDRLDENIIINKETGCHEWIAAKASFGYGYFTVRDGRKKKNYYVHREVYASHHGVIPKGMKILHKCDNPSCSNIDHLFMGTSSDNTRDMINKNRHPEHMKRQEKEGVFVVAIHGSNISYIAPWKGDPGRTCVLDSARKYISKQGAKVSMGMAKKYFPNRIYSIMEVG